MDIKRILKSISYVSLHGEPAGDVLGISYDSRKVRQGHLFVAIPGERDDGTKYVGQAVQHGAIAIVAKTYDPAYRDVLQIIVDSPRLALAAMARAFYGNPSSKLTVIGITGTNGKTTTTYLIESIFTSASKRPAVIGTINYRFMDRRIKASNTTPESLDLDAMMSEFLVQGATDVIMEVSSHALDQGRVQGIDFDMGIFTNLTQDHLDYHRTMEDYYAAKALLFDKLLVASHKGKKFAILNGDDPWAGRIRVKRGIGVLRFGCSRQSDIKLLDSSSSLDGIGMRLSTPIGVMDLSSPLVGHYNTYNIMAAVAAAIVSNISAEHIRQGVKALDNVPGRVERIGNPRGVYAFVDYAHTPDALEKVLIALNELKKKRIMCVFGCGGDRDKGKRPLMGEIATRLADVAIVTSDNPRSEDPGAIMAAIEKGIRDAQRVVSLRPGDCFEGHVYTIIQDRRQAIRTALDVATSGDIVLVAGKGHEDYQIFSERTVHFSDREEITDYFSVPL